MIAIHLYVSMCHSNIQNYTVTFQGIDPEGIPQESIVNNTQPYCIVQNVGRKNIGKFDVVHTLYVIVTPLIIVIMLHRMVFKTDPGCMY